MVDLLIPQRGLLGGWTMLMPCLNLLLPPLCRGEKHETRALVILGIMAGGLPLLHTHSYLALVLLSLGSCLYCVFRDGDRAGRWQRFRPWFSVGPLPQPSPAPAFVLHLRRQRKAITSCGSSSTGAITGAATAGGSLFLLLYQATLASLSPISAGAAETEAQRAGSPRRGVEEAAAVRQYRLIACGAFLIYGIAEFILFQPNEYDNNKLLYVWFALCLPMAADYAVEIWQRLKGLAGRRVIAGLFLFCCFFGPALTVAREWISDYQAYSRSDVETAEFIKDNTPEHSVWLTGNEHLNPVSSLAGRTILCSSESLPVLSRLRHLAPADGDRRLL